MLLTVGTACCMTCLWVVCTSPEWNQSKSYLMSMDRSFADCLSLAMCWMEKRTTSTTCLSVDCTPRGFLPKISCQSAPHPPYNTPALVVLEHRWRRRCWKVKQRLRHQRQTARSELTDTWFRVFLWSSRRYLVILHCVEPKLKQQT